MIPTSSGSVSKNICISSVTQTILEESLLTSINVAILIVRKLINTKLHIESEAMTL